MELKDIYQDINWKALILGGAVFTFIVILANDNQLDWLLIFSSVGLLYIGYASQNKLQGTILGAIGTLPLGLASILFQRLGPISGENIEILIIISFLAIGAFCGFTGAYFKKSRKKAIEEKMKQESAGKGKKKKNNKANR